jgi:hypothetical protein
VTGLKIAPRFGMAQQVARADEQILKIEVPARRLARW